METDLVSLSSKLLGWFLVDTQTYSIYFVHASYKDIRAYNTDAQRRTACSWRAEGNQWMVAVEASFLLHRQNCCLAIRVPAANELLANRPIFDKIAPPGVILTRRQDDNTDTICSQAGGEHPPRLHFRGQVLRSNDGRSSGRGNQADGIDRLDCRC